jgi:hypothetical protein
LMISPALFTKVPSIPIVVCREWQVKLKEGDCDMAHRVKSLSNRI